MVYQLLNFNMFKYFRFTFVVIVVVAVALASVDVALADPINYTPCYNDGTFDLYYLDIQGCDTSSTCKIIAGQDYTVKFSGCYYGTVSPINNIPFVVKAGALYIPLFPIAGFPDGDLCKNFTTDSLTTSCPATVPQPGGACGTWELNINVPIAQLGIIPWLGLPGTVQAKAWANTTFSTPVVCVQFPVWYFTL